MRFTSYILYNVILLSQTYYVFGFVLYDLPKCVQTCLEHEVTKLDCSGDRNECLCSRILFTDSINECCAESCDANDDMVGGLQKLMGHCFVVRRQIEGSSGIAIGSAVETSSSVPATTTTPAPAPVPATTGAVSSASSIVSSATSSIEGLSPSLSSPPSTTSPVTSATVYTVIVSTGTATFATDGSLVTTTYAYTSSVTDPLVFASLLLGSTTSANTPTSSPTDQSGAGSSGLSMGAKIGIGVGVALGSLAILTILGVIWYMRRKKASKSQQNSNIPHQGFNDPHRKAELSNQGLHGGRFYSRNELDVQRKYPHEMDARERAMAAELEAEYYAEMGSKEANNEARYRGIRS